MNETPYARLQIRESGQKTKGRKKQKECFAECIYIYILSIKEIPLKNPKIPLPKIVTSIHFLGFLVFQPFHFSLPWLLHVLFHVFFFSNLFISHSLGCSPRIVPVSSFPIFIPSLFSFLFIFPFLFLLWQKALFSFSLTHFLSLYNLEAFSLSKQQGPPPPPPPISVFYTERDTVCEISFWFMGSFSLLHNSKHLFLVFDIFHSFLSCIFFSSFNLLFFGL